jgi:hypothetical protein
MTIKIISTSEATVKPWSARSHRLPDLFCCLCLILVSSISGISRPCKEHSISNDENLVLTV